MTTSRRRVPVGAEPAPGGTHFRVWAPRRKQVEVLVEVNGALRTAAMHAERGGYFSALVGGVGPGARYRYRLDGGEAYADPASRFQPDGPHGPSEVVSPEWQGWTDGAWKGVTLKGAVLYELHIGTFTTEGTYAAAEKHLAYLRDLGVTVVELMPVNCFNGPFGWGYDGVNWFAPAQQYGRPEDLKHFINAAHAHGLGVILDVVYNHFGPSGNYSAQFSECYAARGQHNEWGEGLNFDGESCAAVRELVVSNAAYWIDEYHFDGLRIDATQCIVDRSKVHVLTELAHAARSAAKGRAILLTCESEPQDTRLVRSVERGGHGMDALWNDDFHHSATVAATGQCTAYYTETRGTPQELLSSVKWGCLYQGQWYAWQKQRRGRPSLDVDAPRFVHFLQNHDQVANSARGLRLHQLTSPGRHRALTALLLLSPETPLLFQGQEFNASTPFLYFAAHGPELDKLVRKGRGDFVAQFPNVDTVEGRALLADPADPATFHACKLRHDARDERALALHRDLLRLRREDPVFRAQDKRRVDGAVIGPEAFVLRFFGDDGDDRLVVVNLGTALRLLPSPEPLIAPPDGMRWRLQWHSEHPAYGGCGMHELDEEGTWMVPGHACAVLKGREVRNA